MTRVLCLAVLVCVVQCLPMSKDELEDFSNFLLKTSSLDLHVKSKYLPTCSKIISVILQFILVCRL